MWFVHNYGNEQNKGKLTGGWSKEILILSWILFFPWFEEQCPNYDSQICFIENVFPDKTKNWIKRKYGVQNNNKIVTVYCI